MTDELFVLDEGQALPTDFTTTPPALNYNTNASVNPRLLTIMGTTDPLQTNRSFIEIHSDDATTLEGGTKLLPTASGDYSEPTLFDTPSYRVTVDTGSASGLSLDFDSYDYFILLYADDLYNHHFAKITEEVQYSGDIYSYDFTPKLGGYVPEGTNVCIFRGPAKPHNVVAVGYGLLNDTSSSEERHDRYCDVSRPTFYFYEDDALEANKKYTAIKTFDPSSNTMVSVFKTAPVTSGMVLDKSFYTQHGDIVDANKTSDDTLGVDITDWTQNIAEYDNRAGATPISTYINFIVSPLRNQTISAPVSVDIKNSITNRGNMFEATYIDPERFLDRKIMDYESVTIKEYIGSDDITDLYTFILPGVMDNHATDTDKIQVTGLLNGQDLRNLLYSSPDYDVIFVNGYYYVISNINAPVDGNQEITITHKRAVSDTTFSATSTVETLNANTGFRRRWSGIVENMGVTHQIDTELSGGSILRNNTAITNVEADIYGLEYIVGGPNYGIKLEVEQGDLLNSYTELQSVPSSIFNTSGNLLDCVRTGLLYNKPLMSSNVEYKETNVDGGVFQVKISGRDKISQLLGTPVNKNYTYTEEYLYTTLSPIGRAHWRSVTGGYTNSLYYNVGIVSISGNTITVYTKSGKSLSDYVQFGDVLFTSIGGIRIPLGVVESISGNTTITLMKNSYFSDFTNIGDLSASQWTIDSTDYYILYKLDNSLYGGKSLEKYNPLLGPTTVLGSIDKGIVFESGHNFTSYNTQGESLSEVTQGSTVNGIPIDAVYKPFTSAGVNKDTPFSVSISNKINALSSMVEFDIINQEQTDGQTIYSLGYISPVVAGRVYGGNRNETWLEGADITSGRYLDSFYLLNGQGLPNGGFIHFLDNEMQAGNPDSSGAYAPMPFNHVFDDDPGYVSTVSSQYVTRFGPPIWRYTNKNQGDFTQRLGSIGTMTPEIEDFPNDYYDNGGEFKFNLSGYRSTLENKYTNDKNSDETLYYLKDKSNERLGVRPALGSRFFDVNRYPSSFHSSADNIGRLIDEDLLKSNYSAFEIWDPRAGTLHLFAPGHVYPESKMNWDNLDSHFGAKSLTDYSIILKRDGESSSTLKHGSDTYPTDWAGVSNTGNRLDRDYENRRIVASTGSRNRFSLVRLTEVTFDFLMNEVDYENYEPGKQSTDNTIKGFLESQRPMNCYVASDTAADLTSDSDNTSNLLLITSPSWIDVSKTQDIYTEPDYNDVIKHLGRLDTTYNGGTGYSGTSSPYTIRLTTNCLIDAVPSGTSIYYTEYDPSNETYLRVVRTSDQELAYTDTYSLANKSDIINKTTSITLPNTGYTLPTVLSGITAATRGFIKRPIILDRTGTTDDVETNETFAQRVMHNSQSGEGVFDYGNMDVVIIKSETFPTEAQKSISDLYNFEGAILSDITTSISNITLSQTVNSVTYDDPDLISTDTAFLETNISGTNDEKVRLTEILFRPKLPGWDDIDVDGDEAVLEYNISFTASSSWLDYCNNLSGYYLYNVSESTLHYIKSHTISKQNGFSHHIKIDNYSASFTVDDDIRLLKISQNCFYDFSPKNITLSEFSSIYTKIPGSNKMHSEFNISGSRTLDGKPIYEESGINSLYCLINIDGDAAKYLVNRNAISSNLQNTFSLGEHNVYLTDGINKNTTSMKITAGVGTQLQLSFGKMREMLGATSVGSIFTVTVDKGATFRPTKAQIGVPFNVVYEAEDIVDDILSSVGLTFNKSTVGNDYYMSANFTGQNAFTAANSVLSYKGKKLLVNGEDISIVADEEDRFYRDIEIAEDKSTYKITNIRRDKSLFDQFNTIAVFGDGIKALAKNYREIKKKGREITKEVYDYTITNQKQANERAAKLLKIHSRINDAIQIDIGDDVPFIAPGQIISVYYPSEGIYRAPYIVIEIERSFGSSTKVKLGEYNRDLANTMSLLLSETRNLQGLTKQKVYSNVTSPNIDISSVRLKFVKADITNLTDDTTSTIGFGYVIGFDSEVGP